ncbi:MAG: hypothetical protein FWE27_02450 [Defluviitaleaceae bacterium]|nr:hypothetical protein [Defluviitaleaceae bacterium]
MEKVFIIILSLILLTSCDTEISYHDGYIPYGEIPLNYSLENAKADGLVVYENGSITSGQADWDAFVSKTEAEIPSMVRLAFYYTLDNQNISPEYYEEIKDGYPVLFIQDLSFDGDIYTLFYTEGESEYNYTYKYLKRLVETPPAFAAFTEGIYYVLVNNYDVTWAQIQQGMIRARHDTGIDHKIVYTKLIYKNE